MSEWYYAHGGEQKGPVPVSELQRLAGNNEFDPVKDLVWREGMDDWKPAEMVPELKALSGPAPEPAAAAPAETTAAPATAPAAADPMNPYAAPTTDATAHESAGVGDDLPTVKRANFVLCATLLVIGTLGFLASYAALIVPILTNPNDPSAVESVGPIAGIGFLVSLALMMTGQIMGMIYVYRAWVLLQPHTAYSTPGKAVGFLFIPFYNLYWIFVAYWRWSQEWNRIVVANPKHRNAPRMSEGLFMTYPIVNLSAFVLSILALLPVLVFQVIVIRGMCAAINYSADR
ncbi:endosomal trafficking protein RME-8 [Haloferula helveola]|uniref:Endosomal trafficking protein RME-8 n=1 Tax=Haloferula helveola TaxID=490095 RepID=A0ABM7R940_9BACT|nr:endosomal trafficking protein RME-8 [Haloferula helveola]